MLDPSAVYQLAAPSTPDAARQEVLAKVEQGEPVRHRDVRQIISRHKLPPQPTITLRAPTHEWRPGITYPHNLHAPTTETETTDETEDAPQSTVSLVAEPTDEPGKVVSLSAVAAASRTLGLLQLLRRLEEARDIVARYYFIPTHIRGQLALLFQGVKDELFRRQTSR